MTPQLTVVSIVRARPQFVKAAVVSPAVHIAATVVARVVGEPAESEPLVTEGVEIRPTEVP